MDAKAKEIDPALLQQRDSLHRHIEAKLADTSLDYADQLQFIKNTWKEHQKHLAAGVFLLLEYRDESPSSGLSEPYFLLIKRSATVAQSGDISCPGGMLNPFFDAMISYFSTTRLLPLLRGEALNYARRRDGRTFRAIRLFLANAARESWEEIGLSPFNVSFLGALPTYSLRLFRRTIFPVVGLIKHPWQYKSNSEVEKIIEIPIKAFFNPGNYGRFYFQADHSWQEEEHFPSYFPCLILKQKDETEEILWGATFNIITNFLSVVFEQSLPMVHENTRKVSKTFPRNYLKSRNLR
ncbi:MAG: putative NUDIX hydrolase [Syntrophus sp. PtaU1.Bin208]|nr:MAG: putative NUDIX hydrolase [Syntrophus sp. PtaU1.Bin208]